MNTTTTGRLDFPERGHRAAGIEERDAFARVARAWFDDIERSGRFVMWLGESESSPHRVTFAHLISGPWSRSRLDYATAVEWDADAFRMILESGEILELVALDDDAAADLPFPCIYTGGRYECDHTGCREEHTGSTVALDYARILDEIGEPCTRCGASSLMRCADDSCDAIVCEACDARGVTRCPACILPDVDHSAALDGSVCYSCRETSAAGDCIPCDACGLESCPACDDSPCPVLSGDRAEILAALTVARARLDAWARVAVGSFDDAAAGFDAAGRLAIVADVVAVLDDPAPVRDIVRDAIANARGLYAS